MSYDPTRKGSAPPPRAKLVIAIDYGTTFSGVAFAHTASVIQSHLCLTLKNELTATQPDVRTLITEYPDAEGAAEGKASDKVPTKLSYTNTGVNWGFQVSEDEHHYAEFKLGLNNVKATTSQVAKQFKNAHSLKLDDRFNARKLTTDYLTALREHIVRVLKNKLGATVVETTPIEWVITVPAIWSPSAESHTRSCARDAGLEGKITVISEPEAAITFALDTMPAGSLQKGDTFVMCDAGGGTVDLISYVIDSVTPLKIREVSVGEGGECGNVFLNRIFDKTVLEPLKAIDGYGADTRAEALSRFETELKRSWDGTKNQVLIPVPGLSNDRDLRIVRAKLAVPADRMNVIFDQVVDEIIPLVKEQITRTGKAVKAILMVGGFGQSPYLRDAIRAAVASNIQVLQPAKGWSAVVQGALLQGLRIHAPSYSRVQVSSRKARRCYGCTATVPFVRREHDITARYVCSTFLLFRLIIQGTWMIIMASTALRLWTGLLKRYFI
jgi:molecular chaperone DnaK (HSP70)